MNTVIEAAARVGARRGLWRSPFLIQTGDRMKTRIAAGLVVLSMLVLALAAVAYAANGSGKLTSFKYDSSTKVGHIVLTAKKKTSYKLNSKTACGVHRGDSGDAIPCKSLGKKKYSGKPVHVTYKKVGKSRVASLVVVDL
jgi:hypothetical protein